MFTFLAEAGGLADTAKEIGHNFGWKPHLFIAQVINFTLVLYVLKRFAFGPIQEILEERKNRIAAGQAKLEEIAQQLADSEKEKAALLEAANNDAKRLVTEAKDSAAALSEKKAQEAVAQAQNILAKAEEAAKAEAAAMKAELKKEFGRLVVETTSQVTGKTLTATDQKRINKEALSSL
ncbi:ATP synthase F0 subunit B [Akkermansiaceae bacterium]|nr:ATP synthase F0 subunit B [Akkermansiaceae bacterium]MDA7888522.1 ATP synthase F0 subunit B [Akkermansiaceae bacterium]MDB4537979.1 ATP synthase F0 subunit B [Akkermansiaceae bacterium]